MTLAIKSIMILIGDNNHRVTYCDVLRHVLHLRHRSVGFVRGLRDASRIVTKVPTGNKGGLG